MKIAYKISILPVVAIVAFILITITGATLATSVVEKITEIQKEFSPPAELSPAARDSMAALQKAQLDALQSNQQDLIVAMTTLILSCVVVMVFLAVWIIRGIRRPLGDLSDVAKRLHSGDLTVTVEGGHPSNEIGVLQSTFQELATNLRAQVGAIKKVSDDVLETSSHIMGTVSQLNAATSEQASAIAQTTSTIEEIRQGGQEAKMSAVTIAETSKTSVTISDQGMNVVSSSLDEIKRVRQQVSNLANDIEQLRKPLAEVGDIMSTVSEITEQSNLLAVNASIEASKAGDFGRGFAVVAQEVKNLAARAKQATTQVRETLGNIHRAIEEVVRTAQDGRDQILASVGIVEQVGNVVVRLGKAIADANAAAQSIAITSNEQLIGIEQVANAMTSVNRAAVENQQGTQSLEQSSTQLNAMARDLEQLVSRYRLS